MSVIIHDYLIILIAPFHHSILHFGPFCDDINHLKNIYTCIHSLFWGFNVEMILEIRAGF